MNLPVRRAEVERQPELLLRKYQIKRPPVDVDELADKLGYQLVYRYFDDAELSGMVIRDATGNITIGINTLHARVRQRFSVAHEIGHAQRHLVEGEDVIVDPPARSIYKRDRRSSLAEDTKEIEANQFAAGLLMPRSFIRDVAKELLRIPNNLTIASLIDALATTFEVSNQAMKFRLINLGVIEPD
jgi:Zn-dependent peptidase ImmA (M78 family)